MMINYKNRFYIYHPDGKFTEEQLIKMLDAAYEIGKKDGYNEGYEMGKKNNFNITYPSDWWRYPYYDTTVTCKQNTTKDYIIPTSNTTATVTNNICREFKYNGTEK